MHSNNDLMDPNWKPKPQKHHLIGNLEDVILWSEEVVKLFKNQSDQELSDSRYSVQINGHIILYLRKALKEISKESNDTQTK